MLLQRSLTAIYGNDMEDNFIKVDVFFKDMNFESNTESPDYPVSNIAC